MLGNSDRSSVGFELLMEVIGRTGWSKIPNVGDVEVSSPAAPTESFKYLDGTSSQYSGTADPETITVNSSFQPNSEEYQQLAAGKLNGNQMNFCLRSGVEQTLYEASQAGAGAALVAITQPGVATFSNTSGGTARRLPNFGSQSVVGQFGAGDCIKVGSKYYVILRIASYVGNTATLTVRDFPANTGSTPVATAVSAGVFSIVKPRICNRFAATVTNAGQFSASPSSPVPTDQVGLALVSGLAGRWELDDIGTLTP